jgi:hypothetical protein
MLSSAVVPLVATVLALFFELDDSNGEPKSQFGKR